MSHLIRYILSFGMVVLSQSYALAAEPVTNQITQQNKINKIRIQGTLDNFFNQPVMPRLPQGLRFPQPLNNPNAANNPWNQYARPQLRRQNPQLNQMPKGNPWGAYSQNDLVPPNSVNPTDNNPYTDKPYNPNLTNNNGYRNGYNNYNKGQFIEPFNGFNSGYDRGYYQDSFQQFSPFGSGFFPSNSFNNNSFPFMPW